MDEMILRLGTAGILAAGGMFGHWLLRRVQVLWLRAIRVPTGQRAVRRGLEEMQDGVPAVLYFTTPTCMPCKTIQRPALRKLQEMLGGGGLQVIEVDSTVHPDLAKEWGVLSVPTTFIIDPQGNPSEVNYGVTPAETLLRQIRAAVERARVKRHF